MPNHAITTGETRRRTARCARLLAAGAACAMTLGLLPALAATPAAAAEIPGCSPETLALTTPGTLTFGTQRPTLAPFYIANRPSSGKGFEGEIAYAIAAQLGFARSQVTWRSTPFADAIAPGAKDFDIDLNSISITPARRRNVDFTRPYYASPKGVIVKRGSTYASATTLDELAAARFGAQAETTNVAAARRIAAGPVAIYGTTEETIAAFNRGAVDAMIWDLPLTVRLVATSVSSGVVVGQFPTALGSDWGAVLEKGSSLTPCVDRAIGALLANGTIERARERWMPFTEREPTLAFSAQAVTG